MIWQPAKVGYRFSMGIVTNDIKEMYDEVQYRKSRQEIGLEYTHQLLLILFSNNLVAR